MNVLVTGGAGYIGSHTVRLLKKNGWNVVVYDNLVKGHRLAVKDTTFIQGDILDSQVLAQTIQDYSIDAVVHFAAYSLVGESMENPAQYYQNNVVGTLNLLNVMRSTGVKKLVFSSTAAVYGEPQADYITEDMPKQPTNVYGRTKLMMESVMEDYACSYGLRYVALRYFNACGADTEGDIGEDHRPETHLLPLVLQTCLGQRDSIQIFGSDYPTPDGTCIRDYIHVNDLAMAHVLALQALYNGCSSAAYNLGNGSGFSVRQIIEAAEFVTGIQIEKKIVSRRAGDPPVLVASSEKIRSELGWRPVYTDIGEIIRTAWRWHKNNPHGFALK